LNNITQKETLTNRHNLLREIVGRVEGGAKKYDSEKAWASTNHSIISGQNQR
jgi:hypothetical protein